MRVSLYPHELAVVERLTIKLTELHMSHEDYEKKSNLDKVGIGIFYALMDYMYEHGNYRHKMYEPCTLREGMAQSYSAEPDFSEVSKLTAKGI